MAYGRTSYNRLSFWGALWIIYSLCGVAIPLLLLKLYHGLLNIIKTK